MNVLLVFAKRLALGKVKTRLEGALGQEGALAAYRELVEAVCSWMNDGNWKAVWCLTGPGDWEWKGGQWEQVEGDLGERMEAAVDRAFAEGAQRVVVVGTDIPDLNGAVISRMFWHLEAGADVVTVPVRDGGYGAIGLRSQPMGWFRGRTWSHGLVHEEAVVRAAAWGMRFCALPCLSDVDEPEDWAQWAARRQI
jgi:rSAM/selenodomain-associated transferase 1